MVLVDSSTSCNVVSSTGDVEGKDSSSSELAISTSSGFHLLASFVRWPGAHEETPGRLRTAFYRPYTRTIVAAELRPSFVGAYAS